MRSAAAAHISASAVGKAQFSQTTSMHPAVGKAVAVAAVVAFAVSLLLPWQVPHECCAFSECPSQRRPTRKPCRSANLDQVCVSAEEVGDRGAALLYIGSKALACSRLKLQYRDVQDHASLALPSLATPAAVAFLGSLVALCSRFGTPSLATAEQSCRRQATVSFLLHCWASLS